MPGMGSRATLTWDTAFNHWTFSPAVTAAVLVAAALYGWGVRRSFRRRGRSWPWPRTAAFGGGLAVIALSTQSSIGYYDRAQFWVHMILHLTLIMVAPALLVSGRPIMLLMHTGSPAVHRATKRIMRSWPISALTHPVVAVVIYTAAVLVTHLTGAIGPLMSGSVGPRAEQLLYLAAGYLYFQPIFGDEPIRWRVSYPMRIVLLFLSMPVDTFTGISMLQSDDGMSGISASALHSGGAVMWIGGDFIMLAAMMLVFGGWLRRDAQRGAADRRSWFEQARASVLAERTATPQRRGGMDTDEEQLAAYNAWLAKLNERESSRDSPR